MFPSQQKSSEIILIRPHRTDLKITWIKRIYIRDQLGHSSIKITVDIYGHLIPGGNKEAVDKLDDYDNLTESSATIRNLSVTANKKDLNISA